MKSKTFTITDNEKELVKSLLQKITETKRDRFSVVDLETIYGFLNKKEIAFLKKLLTLNPKEYGFKGEFFGIDDVPKDLIEIEGQKYEVDTEEGFEEIGVRYLPKKVYDAYTKMNKKMFKDIGKKLLIASGYRSSAYQLFLFVWYLNMFEFDVEKTVQRVAMPGYSEHCLGDTVAIDFITTDGVPNEHYERRFEDRKEYAWLLKNADKFGFKESYPKDNEFGISYEPWHWKYVNCGIIKD